MWILALKIVLSFCVCVLGYSKQDYINWKRGLLATTTTPSVSENDIYENLKFRHHSRFPNLDRVILKIDGMESKTTENRYRHRGWKHRTTTTTTTTTDEGLFDDYYEDDDDITDYNSDNEDNDYEDNSDDEDLFSGNDWQAEEATEPPVTAPVSRLTNYKWANFGTRSRVEESRRQQLHLKPSNEQKGTHAAVEHYMKIQREGKCRNPIPKVIPVQSVHPDPSKSYTPHCTILHRCAEDTGCCPNYERCGAKTEVPVQLYFYSKTLGAETKVEKLTFLNHTECHCMKSKSESSENLIVHSASSTSQPEEFRRCRCPKEFVPKYRYTANYCTCDCEEDNLDCLQMKRGNEYFSLTDRKCMKDDLCGTPVCEYGIYLQMGRCQRKQEKLDSYSKLTIK